MQLSELVPERCTRDDGPMALHITGDTAADALLTDNPLALLVGMLLDQQIAMETAFTGPLKIEQRTGSMDAAAIAAYDPDALASVFKETPAVHRFPGSMAARVQSLCQALVDDWGGDAAALWTEGDPDGATVLKRLKALPGFGEQKAKIFLALLGKQDDTGERGCLRGEGIGDEIDRDAVEQRGLERPAEASRGVEHGDLCADLRPLEGRDEPRHAPADHDDAGAPRTQQRVGSPRGFGRIGHASILAGLRGRQRPRVVACG